MNLPMTPPRRKDHAERTPPVQQWRRAAELHAMSEAKKAAIKARAEEAAAEIMRRFEERTAR